MEIENFFQFCPFLWGHKLHEKKKKSWKTFNRHILKILYCGPIFLSSNVYMNIYIFM